MNKKMEEMITRIVLRRGYWRLGRGDLMQRIISRYGRAKRRLALAVGVVGLAILVNMLPVGADHGAPHVEALTRNTFATDVAAQFRVKLDDRTLVRNVRDASDVVLAKITIAPGVEAGWHGHTGPAVLMVAGPGTLTSMISDDCVAREYLPGSALIDPGQGSLHWAVNNSSQDVVVYALFFGVANGPVLPADPPPGCPTP
jgi:quercetin dioxygenase-like cupin family protein